MVQVGDQLADPPKSKDKLTFQDSSERREECIASARASRCLPVRVSRCQNRLSELTPSPAGGEGNSMSACEGLSVPKRRVSRCAETRSVSLPLPLGARIGCSCDPKLSGDNAGACAVQGIYQELPVTQLPR